MRCDSVRDFLAEFLDGILDHREAKLVREHVVRCTACANDLADLKQSIQLCASLDEVDLPPNFRTRLHARLTAIAAEQPVSSGVLTLWRRRFAQPVVRWGMGAAAAVAAFVIIFSGWMIPGDQSPMVKVSQEDLGNWPNVYALRIEGRQAPEEVSGSQVKPGLGEKPTWVIVGKRQDLKLVHTGEIDLGVVSAPEVSDQIVRLAQEMEGLVESSEPAAIDGSILGKIVIQIPSDAFDQMLAQISKLGVVRDQQINTQDVTAAYLETEGLLRELRVQENRLLELLNQPRTFSQVLAIEQELGRIRESTAPLTGQLETFDKAVAMSTLAVNLVK